MSGEILSISTKTTDPANPAPGCFSPNNCETEAKQRQMKRQKMQRENQKKKKTSIKPSGTKALDKCTQCGDGIELNGETLKEAVILLVHLLPLYVHI